MDPAVAAVSAPASVVFQDGLGDRRHVIDPTGTDTFEVLCLRNDLTAVPSFEFALRERVSRLANFRHTYYGRVRSVERSSDQRATLALVSERTQGVRLSEILAGTEHRGVALDINAALCLIRQLVPAVAMLHENMRDVAHGAIGPERLLVTSRARLVIVEYVMGAALEQLRYSHERYWKELRIALPRSAGLPRFDHRADVTQIGVVALSLILGRPLHDDEYPGRVRELVASAWAISARGGLEPLTPGLRAWLSRALQLDLRDSFGSALEARDALDEVLSSDSDYIAAPASLETFLSRYEASAEPAAPVKPAAPPVAPPVAVATPKAVPPSTPAKDTAPRVAPPPVASPAPRPAAASVTPAVVRPVDSTVATRSADSSPAPRPGDAPPVTRHPDSSSASGPTDSPSSVARPFQSRDRETTGLSDPEPSREAKSVAPHSPTEPSREAKTVAPRPSPETSREAKTAAPRPSAEPSRDVKRVVAPPAPAELPRDARSVTHPPSAALSIRIPEYEPPQDEEIDDDPEPQPTSKFRLPRMLVAAVLLVAAVGGGIVAVRRYVLQAVPVVSMGTLSVNTNPPGAQVLIDGELRGATPFNVELKSGAHVLELRGGAEPRTIPLTIAAGAHVSQYIDLPKSGPVTGQLQIRTEPAGAVVTVDNVARGKSPITIADLAPGEHTVALESDLGSVKQTVTIEAGTTASLMVPLTPQDGSSLSGWVSVTAPIDVQLYENGRLLGTSQSDRIMVSAGSHQIDIVNEPLGYRVTRTVQVPAGKVSPIAVKLPMGTIALNAVPWAEVWIDGAKVGETPIGNLPVTIGAHEILFRHPDLGEQRHAVSVTLTAPARLSVDLRKQ